MPTCVIDSDLCLQEAMPGRGEPLKPSIEELDSQSLHLCHGDLAGRQGSRLIAASARHGIKIGRVMLQLSVTAALAIFPVLAKSQLQSYSGDPSGTASDVTSGQRELTYQRPTQKTMAGNYVLDAFGPYPVVAAAFAAGIGQLDNAPPEWNQGAKGFGKRFGSDFGIAAVAITTRYGLAEALKEDTLYYRCECRGVLPRVSHAVISTFTARRGEDGHRVFSLPVIVAPYAGSMTAVYGWYPDRYGPKDAFRFGNYSLLVYVGGNIVHEFFHSGPHSLLSRMHLNNEHDSPDPGPNH